MEWLRISTSTELVRVATDEIVYVRADGNYSDLVLTNGKSRKMTFQLHFFDEVFQQLQNNVFTKVGRSLIVNKRYIHVINLTEQILIYSGPIHGLKATIEFEEPDTADSSVYLYSRCADYAASGDYLGSLVAEGVEKQSDRSRLGYMAMADGNMVIGVSRSEKVKDYVLERGGSFFRQFILVSNGTIPSRFFLHGKVERRAIGRIDDQLYYIATRHKETLWDFADALREYGFIDAIYITGGADYVFYRNEAGIRHDIGDAADYPHKKWKGVIPWLVFRQF